MSAYAELSAAVRDPMREWWKSTGSWVLFAVTLCWIGDACITPIVYSKIVPYGMGRVLIYVLWILWSFGSATALPVSWVLAVRKLISLTESPPAQLSPNLPALFLVCARQAIWPLLLLTFLRVGNHTFYHIKDGDSYWWWNAVAYVPSTFTFWLHSLPVMLVALALYLLTRKLAYATILIASVVAQEVAWFALRYHNPVHPPELWGVKLMLELCLGLGSMWVLFYNVLERRKEKWVTAYWFIVGAIIASPLLIYFYRHGGSTSWLLRTASLLCNGTAYLASAHGTIGNWLSESLAAASTPSGGSLLSVIAPVVPFLWKVGWQVGLISWLHWLLGAPWRRWRSLARKNDVVQTTAQPT